MFLYCGKQNGTSPTLKDVHVLIPRACECVWLHSDGGGGGIKAARGVKIANQLTLR